MGCAVKSIVFFLIFRFKFYPAEKKITKTEKLPRLDTILDRIKGKDCVFRPVVLS